MRLDRLSASFDGFRAIEFRDGLNIVVADRDSEATKTDSRNGLGKTTVIALIDFCLGANMSDRLEQMRGNRWYFTLSLTTRQGVSLDVTRSPDSSGDIQVVGDVVRAGLEDARAGEQVGSTTIGQRRWTRWLGEESFRRSDLTAEAPSYRSLIRHLARYRTDSLIDPFRTLANQRAEAVQAENAYLLNLDWRLAGEWADLKERRTRITLADDPDHPIDDRIAALEPQLVRSKRRTEQLASDISSFSVLPEYREIESNVQGASARIKSLGNSNIIDRQQLALYRSQSEDESSADEFDIHRLFTEAGVSLGETVIRSLSEAAEFQRQVTANRVAYLADEARRLEGLIASREAEQERLAAQQEQDLQLLRTGGALDDFVVLQRNLAESQVEVALVEEQIQTLRDLSARKSQLKSQELSLGLRTKMDLQERFELRSTVIARFGEIMEDLYGEPADLRVLPGKSGVQFKVVLPRTGSGGVHLMAIFAYDIALSEDLASRDRGPGFLLHDSAIFADVDERQTAKAIEVAASSAATFGYQHLITVNSDHVPWDEFVDRSVFDKSVVLRLHDGHPGGGLLGQRLHFAVDSDG